MSKMGVAVHCPWGKSQWQVLGSWQQRVYEMQIHNVDELKQRVADVWSGLQQSVVDAAVSKNRKCL